MTTLYLNGHLVNEADAKISIYDRSYLFGEGLFETLRSFDGKIPLLSEHLKRLEWSATFLNLDYPTEVDFEQVCTELLKKNALKDARLKIVLSRTLAKSEGGAGPESQNNLVIFCEPLPARPAVYKLKVIRSYINDAAPVSALKSTNSLVKLLGRMEAKDAGYEDGLLLNAKGLVTEATTGNVFWVDEKGVLHTVAEAHGLLRGVMKQELSKLIKEKNLVIRESPATPTEISSAREVFLTNSVVGIMPVVGIDSRQISGGEPGAVTLMLKDLWENKLKEML